MPFTSLGLSKPLLRAIEDKGYTEPSPIQAEAIPAVLTGRDVMAAAQTGTGKTAGFTLPLLQRLSDGPRARSTEVRALVLTPTRELAAQVHESVETYGKHLPLRSAVVFGGVNIRPQINKLRGGLDILVATPGRLLDLHGQRAVTFPNLEVFILDEADRMLDMGFIRDIKRIIKFLPRERQNLMFSATFSDEIRQLTQGLLYDPLQIEVSPRNAAAETVAQSVYEVDKGAKTALITHLIADNNWEQVLVFTRTKHGANRLSKKLDQAGISSAAIHGNKSQGARTKALAGFKANKIRVLVATDIAARGIDINELPHVVNFELPQVPEDYVHRIGRTGRAGSEGEAISLVCTEEVEQLSWVEHLIKRTLDRRVEPGFEPQSKVKPTSHTQRLRKPKKPKSEGGQGGGQRGGGGSQQRRRRPSGGGGGGGSTHNRGRSQRRRPISEK